jgi:glycyl-tRNA synthetase
MSAGDAAITMAEDSSSRPEPFERGEWRLDDLAKLVALCKRRGFVFPSSEIYGGFASTWDYGPLGVLLKNNVKSAWWRSMVQLRDEIVGLDTAILMHPQVWVTSGHVEHFNDPLVECKQCHQRFRADEVEGRNARIAVASWASRDNSTPCSRRSSGRSRTRPA